MKTVRASVAIVLLLAPLAAQLDKAREHLGEVRELAAAKDPFGAAQRLRAADLCLSRVDASAERDAVAADLATLVADVDPLLPRRREMESRLAAEFAAMSTALLAAGCPRTAALMAEDAVRFDEVVAADAQAAAKAGVRSVDMTAKTAQADAGFEVWFKTLYFFKLDKDGKKAKKVSLPKHYRALHPDIPTWLKARSKAAKDVRSLAGAYKSKGRLQLAFEVVAIGDKLDREVVAKVYGPLRVAANEQKAERIYVRECKPHMDEFRGNSNRLGGSKGWKLGPRVFTAPKPSTKSAMLISGRQLKGNYGIKVDLQLQGMLGVMQVVVAWRNEDDYCVLEFQRPRASYSWLRIVHIVKGSRTVLQEARAKQTMRDYFTLEARVRNGRIKASLGSASCEAESPIDTSAGVSFGFARPALTSKPKKAKKGEAINLRNLVIDQR